MLNSYAGFKELPDGFMRLKVQDFHACMGATDSFSIGGMFAVFIRDSDRNAIELDAYAGSR